MAKSTSYEGPRYAVFSNLLSHRLSSIQILSSAPYCQTPSVLCSSTNVRDKDKDKDSSVLRLVMWQLSRKGRFCAVNSAVKKNAYICYIININ
jgi:hypothetical protein